MLILEAILNVIKKENLLENVEKTGQYLKCGLLDIEKEFYDILDSTRGRGTFLAINASDGKLRDQILNNLKRKGFLHVFLVR